LSHAIGFLHKLWDSAMPFRLLHPSTIPSPKSLLSPSQRIFDPVFVWNSVPSAGPRSVSSCSDMKSPRKKKRPKPPKKGEERKGAEGVVEGEEERKKRVLEALVDAFSLSSIREASIAYDIAGCDLERASEILRKGLSEDSFSCCSSSCSGGSSGGGTSSSSSSGMDLGSKEEAERNCGEGVVVGGFKGGKQKKKVVASTGTVSTVLGKEYVRRNKGSNKGFSANDEVFDMEKAEQFLCSMLGEDCDLNLAVVRDVLCK